MIGEVFESRFYRFNYPFLNSFDAKNVSGGALSKKHAGFDKVELVNLLGGRGGGGTLGGTFGEWIPGSLPSI